MLGPSGAWRSLVAPPGGGRAVAGSNPAAPTHSDGWRPHVVRSYGTGCQSGSEPFQAIRTLPVPSPRIFQMPLVVPVLVWWYSSNTIHVPAGAHDGFSSK